MPIVIMAGTKDGVVNAKQPRRCLSGNAMRRQKIEVRYGH